MTDKTRFVIIRYNLKKGSNKMKITERDTSKIIDRSHIKNGEVFYFEGEYYMAMETLSCFNGEYTYDAINLRSGVCVWIGDEEVYQVDYEFIIK